MHLVLLGFLLLTILAVGSKPGALTMLALFIGALFTMSLLMDLVHPAVGLLFFVFVYAAISYYLPRTPPI